MPFTEAAAPAQPTAVPAPHSVPGGSAAAVGSEPALADVAARPAEPREGLPSVPPAVPLAALLPADEEEDDYD